MDQRVPEPPESPVLFRPRGVGEILSHAFQIYRMHWQHLIALVAIIVIPLSILQVVLSDVVVGDSFSTTTTVNGQVEINGSFGSAIGASLAALVIFVLMWTILTGAITRAAAGTFLGREMDIAESYRFGLARFWSIVLVGILAFLAIALGFILLVIPGFIVLTRLTCAMPSLVIEDRRGSSALRRSWDLVKGFGWHVFGTVFVAGILTGLVSGVLTAPFGDNTALRAIFQSLASVITMPYTALVGILIYLDLRVRKERYSPDDLARELDRAPA
jgi:hypothetical protein